MELAAIESNSSTPLSRRSQLSAIESLVQKGSTTDAVELARSLKAIYPKNIFVVALYSQIEKLLAAETNESPDARTLRESLPRLIERATEATRNATPARAAGEHPATSADLQKRKALEQVKTKYFNLAEAFMKKGYFENALAEVRRVLMIDPSDENAKQYAMKLDELLQLHSVAVPAIGENGGHAEPSTSDQLSPSRLVLGTARRSEQARQPYYPPVSLDDLVKMTKPDFDSIIARTRRPNAEPPSIDPTPTMVRFSTENRATAQPKRWSSASFLLGSAFFIAIAIAASYFITTSYLTDGTGDLQVETSPPARATQHMKQNPATRKAIQQPATTMHVAAAKKDSLNSTN